MNPQLPNRSTSPTRIAVTFVSLAIATMALVLLVFLVYTVATTSIPFDNDEANHAVDGWQVYRAIVHLNLPDLYRAIVSRSFYPPIHSVFVAMSYGLGEPGIATSRMPTVFIGAIAVLGMAGLVFGISYSESKTDRWLPIAGATFSVTLAICSLTFILNSVICMLEMTGAMLGILLIAIAHGVDRCHRWRSGWVAASAIAVMAIFLTKYSFGLFFGCGLIAALLGEAFPQAIVRKPASLFHGQTRRDLTIVLIIYATILGLWLSIAHRPTIWRFFTGHPSYASFWSMENLLFYPKVWLSDYSSHAIVGFFALILAIVGAVGYWHYLCVRVAAWSALAATGILTISTTNSLRHLFVVVPGMWMLAGLGLVEVLRLLRHSRGDRVVVRAIVLLWTLLVISAIKPSLRLHDELIATFEGLPIYTQMQDFALQNVDLHRPGLLVGFTSDQYRLLAMRWRAAVLSDQSLEDLDLDYFPFDTRERSLHRTHRKPQMASIDPNFPREPLQAVLDRKYYAWAIETREGNEPIDVSLRALQGYPHRTEVFEDWQIIIYQLLMEDRP
ncbi:hypothetical protein IQ235_01815 [Oscillatoriales cyanobacterium LEGE 11467]|uniref:Uncharacterized protein n=1 Tax=Zarconia navalis LEGE 11467 TaxID=1828826 RepID=A0A928Z5P7_9CYAN|nr:hypothetical protein [Zarconia navalis]MBE9039532.1 hypothetical protein [Zarconia navalis LEGE 11467]